MRHLLVQLPAVLTAEAKADIAHALGLFSLHGGTARPFTLGVEAAPTPAPVAPPPLAGFAGSAGPMATVAAVEPVSRAAKNAETLEALILRIIADYKRSIVRTASILKRCYDEGYSNSVTYNAIAALVDRGVLSRPERGKVRLVAVENNA